MTHSIASGLHGGFCAILFDTLCSCISTYVEIPSLIQDGLIAIRDYIPSLIQDGLIAIRDDILYLSQV